MAVDTIAERAAAAAAAAAGRASESTKAPAPAAGKTTTATKAPAASSAVGKATTATKTDPAAAAGKSKTDPGAAAAGRSKTGSIVTTPGGASGIAIDVTNVGDAPGSLAWTDYAVKYGAEYGVPPEIVLALIQAESGGNQYVVGDSGASVGLFQLHERGVGAGYSVEERQNPELQFRLMMPRIAAAYNAGVAAGYTGRNLAVYVGYTAEKPAAGSEANYAYGYDVVTSYVATGTATVGGVPDIMPSGGTPAAPWQGWSRGGRRGTAPIDAGAAGYTGQGVTEGLYYNGPTTYSGGSTSYTPAGGSSSGSFVVSAASGAASVVGTGAGGLLGELFTFVRGLNTVSAGTSEAIATGGAVGVAQTPLGPIAVESAPLRALIWNGGFIAVGLILVAIGAGSLVNWRAVQDGTRAAVDTAKAAAVAVGA